MVTGFVNSLTTAVDSISFDIANSTNFLLEPLFFNLVLHTAVSEDEQGRGGVRELNYKLTVVCGQGGENGARGALDVRKLAMAR